MAENDLLQTWQLGAQAVPGIWRYMLPPDLEDLGLPAEKRSSCHNCPKVVSDDYSPSSKCCTYHPRIPNFLLGLSLMDNASRDVVLPAIKAGYCVPEGAHSSPREWLDAVELGSGNDYGKTETVRCHFLNEANGSCGIYPYRNSICSTFFCLNDHGHSGSEFWDRMQEFVSQVETALAQWCLSELGFDIDRVMSIYDQQANAVLSVFDPRSKAWSESFREELFGSWFGREPQLFLRCAELVIKHKLDLYDIAREVKIKEPYEFEQALVSLVPDDHSEGIDASYLHDPGEPAKVDDLWYVAKLAHRQMSFIPTGSGYVRLNPAAVVSRKDPAEKMSRFYNDETHCVTLTETEADKEHSWRQYLQPWEAQALQWFEQPRSLGAVYDSALLKDKKIPQDFLSEWLRKHVLQWVEAT